MGCFLFVEHFSFVLQSFSPIISVVTANHVLQLNYGLREAKLTRRAPSGKPRNEQEQKAVVSGISDPNTVSPDLGLGMGDMFVLLIFKEFVYLQFRLSHSCLWHGVLLCLLQRMRQHCSCFPTLTTFVLRSKNQILTPNSLLSLPEALCSSGLEEVTLKKWECELLLCKEFSPH